MVILLAGATHTGKTALAMRLSEKLKMPCYSIDLIKMGLIRSGQTQLNPGDDEKLTPYLWSIVREIIKTAIENGQNLIIEGCYIPFDWQSDFDESYLSHIKYICLVMTEEYIINHFADIIKYENIAERRLFPADISMEKLIFDNNRSLSLCKEFKLDCIIVDKSYTNDIDAI